MTLRNQISQVRVRSYKMYPPTSDATPSPGCYLCFSPTRSLDLINLQAGLRELKTLVYSLDYPFFLQRIQLRKQPNGNDKGQAVEPLGRSEPTAHTTGTKDYIPGHWRLNWISGSFPPREVGVGAGLKVLTF